MRIAYQPRYAIGSVTHAITNTTWVPGEAKEIEDDAKVRLRSGGEVFYVRVIDELLSSPDFVDAQSGKNPLYTCTRCNEFTREEFFLHQGGLSMDAIPAQIDGKRVCKSCFDKAVTWTRTSYTVNEQDL